jgi:Fic family protein
MRRVKEGFPISGRLFREIHAELLAKGRGSEKAPGEYRTSQNWIGGERPGRAIFVPPPPDRVADCMSELERFLHDDPARTPTLEKAALAHVQFETIHPFLDGNGRLGRLLTTLVFVSEGVLRQPLLYLSLYLKAHRDTYYDLLQRVRTDGDWESWVGFFARGVRQTADQAVSSAQELASLFKEDRSKIQELGRSAGSALQVHYALQQHPIQTVNSVTRRSGLSVPTVTAAMRRLEEAGLVRELTGKQRNRVFAYHRYLDVLNEGTTTPGR